MQEEKIRLTAFSHGAGCGCKIAPDVLQKILSGGLIDDARGTAATASADLRSDHLLVGNESGDDAAVFDLSDEVHKNGNDCLVSTTDFFMPIVDDAFDFGRIAAANALSDVYAMGGKPMMALAILGWPVEKLKVEEAQKILLGAKSICREAGITLAGGHTIDSPEPLFGLCVNGMINRSNIRRNNTAKSGDLLFLTKPLGTGILSTALKRKLITEEAMEPAIREMVKLNRAGQLFATLDYVHAMTDVTGFGLLGHLLEMCEGSNVSATLYYPEIKLIEGVLPLAKKFVAPDNTFRNWKSYEKKVTGISGEKLVTLCDPQTSGGLLVAVDEKFAQPFTELLSENELMDFVEPIGRLNEKKETEWISVTTE
jgi:selenide,water dikinase